MARNFSRFSLIGTFVCRAALCAAGKFYPVKTAEQRERFISEATELAQNLKFSLLRSEGWDFADYMARSLVDFGGPYWSLAYNQYTQLDVSDKRDVVRNLVELTTDVATELMAEAERDSWIELIAEASDPIGWVLGDPMSNNTRRDGTPSPARMDLLIRRSVSEEEELEDGPNSLYSRLVLDLKFRSDLSEAKVNKALSDVVTKYGVSFLLRTGKPIPCAVLAFDEDGNMMWSRERVARPRGLQGEAAEKWRSTYSRRSRRRAA